MPLLNELKISKDLIRYQTITPKDDGIMRYISKKLRSLGFKCKLLKFSDKKKSSAPILNLYARRGNKGPKRLSDLINKSFKFNYEVAVNEHCFACTAGAGSSCGGTLT